MSTKPISKTSVSPPLEPSTPASSRRTPPPDPLPLTHSASAAVAATATGDLEVATASADPTAAAAATSALDSANADLKAASAPVNFPANFAFEPRGCEALNHVVDGWMQAHPDDHIMSDDLIAMYQNVDLTAAFTALRRYQPDLVPSTRLIYGTPNYIWLVRSDGPLRPAYIHADACPDDSRCSLSDVRSPPISPDCSADDFVRACRGGHQGCPAATNLSLCAYHVALHHINKQHPHVRIACVADDTYMGASPAILYPAFDDKRTYVARDEICGVSSHLGKVTAYSPRGDMALAPAHIPGSALHPAGVLSGFKCVGVFKGRDTWTAPRTTDKVMKRLAPLTAIDQLVDTERHTNISHLRRTLYTRCAANQSSYYAACMSPAAASPMLHAADDRLRASWESLTCADASPLDRRDRAWHQTKLPTNLGGCGLHDSLNRRPAIRTASQLATLLTLRRTSPIFADADPLTSSLPFFVELRDTYASLRDEHSRLLRLQAEFDRTVYHTLYGTVWTRYHPASLPPAKAVPPLTELLSPSSLAKYDALESPYKPPSQRQLSAIISHASWYQWLDECHAADASPSRDTAQSHREAARAVDCSQFGSGAFCDADPDASLPRLKQASGKLILALQRRLGLYISSAKPAYDALAAAGEPVDYLGDTLCNSGDHHDRHDVGVRAWRDAAAAVATGPVHLCDKEDHARNRHYCERKIADIAMPGASPWGTDVLIECKTPSPFTTATHAGQGGPQGGTTADVGHLFAHGNTEEGLRLTNLGCAQRGSPRDPPLDHSTGYGYVAARAGVYDDAIHVKHNSVQLAIISTFGAFGRQSQRMLKFYSRRARDKKHGRDATRYSRYRSASYLSHHLQCLSTGIIMADASRIVANVVALKQRAMSAM